MELYLRAWNRQRDIVKQLQSSLGFVNETIALFKEGQMSENEQTFKPYLYNIWTLQRQHPLGDVWLFASCDDDYDNN